MWPSLAGSLALHGAIVGGLALSSGSGTADLFGGDAVPGAAGSGDAILVSLIEALGQTGADSPAVPPQAAVGSATPVVARSVEPANGTKPRRDAIPLAPALDTVSGERPAPPTRPPASSQPRPASSVALARAEVPTPDPPRQPATAEQSAASPPTLGGRANGAGPGGGATASAGPGSGSGYGTGPFDRAAQPAGSIHPHYPPRARQRGEEADVTVEVWVGAEGEVDRIAVSSSAGAEFDAAAIEAVQRARFHPALRDGERVPSRVALLLHFRLEP
jgi:protein TonB